VTADWLKFVVIDNPEITLSLAIERATNCASTPQRLTGRTCSMGADTPTGTADVSFSALVVRHAKGRITPQEQRAHCCGRQFHLSQPAPFRSAPLFPMTSIHRDVQQHPVAAISVEKLGVSA